MTRLKTWLHLVRKGVHPRLAWTYSRMPVFQRNYGNGRL